MNATDLSANSSAGLAILTAEAGAKSAPAGLDTQPEFSDLLMRMATAGAQAASTTPIQITERRPTWREDFPQARGAESGEGEGDGDGTGLSPLLPSEGTPTASVEKQVPDGELRLPAVAPPRPEAAAVAIGPAPAEALPVAVSVPPPAPRPAPAIAGPGPQEPAETQGAPVMPRSLRGEAPAPDEAAVRWAPGSEVIAAGGRVAVLAQERHFAPAPSLRQPGHGIPGRAPGIAVPESAGAPAGTVAPVAARPTAAAAVPLAGSGQLEGDDGATLGATGDIEPRTTGIVAPERIAAPASPRPERAVPEASTWEGSSGGGEGPRHGEDVAPSRPAPATDSSLSNVAKDSPRAASGHLPPTQQVAGRIVAAALAVQPDGRHVDPAAPRAASAPLVKVLRLELQPADLGTITIRLSLKDDALDIRLEASRHGTAGMLQKDQEALVKLLASAGYRIDGVAVTASGGDGALAPDGRAAFGQSAAPEQWSSSQADARSSGGRQGAPPDPRTYRGKQNDDSDKIGVARGVGGDLYL